MSNIDMLTTYIKGCLSTSKTKNKNDSGPGDRARFFWPKQNTKLTQNKNRDTLNLRKTKIESKTLNTHKAKIKKKQKNKNRVLVSLWIRR